MMFFACFESIHAVSYCYLRSCTNKRLHCELSSMSHCEAGIAMEHHVYWRKVDKAISTSDVKTRGY